jgi:hypothetical protein
MVITMLLEGFPSSGSSITDATINTYAMALHEFDLALIRKACGRFVRGEVDRLNHNRAPSAPELAIEVRRLAVETEAAERWADTVFIPADGPEWKALVEARAGRQMPRTDRNGVEGWYVSRNALKALQPQIKAHSDEMARIVSRGPLLLSDMAGSLKRIEEAA